MRKEAAEAAGVLVVVVRRAVENKADFAQVWLAMARVAKLRDERRVERDVAVRRAAEAEEEGLMADSGRGNIYNLGGESRREAPKGLAALAGRGSVFLRCDARNDRRNIGGELSVAYAGGSKLSRGSQPSASTDPDVFPRRRGMPSLNSGHVRKQQVPCRASGSGHTQRTHTR